MTNLNPKDLLDLLNNDPDALRDHLRSMLSAPTMADVKWDDNAHAGLCAEHPNSGLVRMMYSDSVGDIHYLYMGRSGIYKDWADPSELTPIPGTKINLTPRRPEDGIPRPEDVPRNEIWAVRVGNEQTVGVRNAEDSQPWAVDRLDGSGLDWYSDSDVTLLHKGTPEVKA